MSDTTPVIVWFRRDLRLTDNPALSEAVSTGRPLVLVYILETDAERKLGGASLWWLHHSLASLQTDVQDIGGTLHIARGDAHAVLKEIVSETGASHIFWNRRYEGERIEKDKAIKSDLEDNAVTVSTYRASLLTEPWQIKTNDGGYYKVFSPYWRAVRKELSVAPICSRPERLECVETLAQSVSLDDLELCPTSPDWASKMGPHWDIGETGAQAALEEFLAGAVGSYKTDRNRPDLKGTSQLSPHLAFGEISPRYIWHASQDASGDVDKFLSEIGWREFSYVLLYHNPELSKQNYKDNFDKFPWEKNPDARERWQHGMTGYPFVDAGMRELWATGWMHNRVRMVVASFLIKHLLIDWREGEAWFWDTLVDADPANNAASWQWVAGSGADAAPYFRIFNPIKQGQDYDPNGDYIRKWVPELKHLPDKFLHTPWEAPALVLKEADVELGKTYPNPIVDHKPARERALEAYEQTK